MPKPINPYDRYLDMPGVILPAKTVATLAPLSFLQNLTIDAEGTIIATSLLDGRLWRLPYGGEITLLCQIDGRPSGISPAPDGGWLVFGWDVHGKVTVFRVHEDGRWGVFAAVPDAIFPNGAVRIGLSSYLFADSFRSTIWLVDYTEGSVTPWYEHPLLGPVEGNWAPALNGLQMWEDRLFMSNSATRQLLAMTIKDGQPTGDIEIVHDDIELDDFAFDIDGTLYSGTHPNDVILRLTQAGELSRAAGPNEGVRGCTACQFGRRPGDETGLYVVADGGLFNPMSGGMQPARIVRLEVGTPGLPVASF